MTYSDANHPWRGFWATPLLLGISSGCTATTTSIVVSEQPSMTRLRLSHEGANALQATLRQEGHTVFGTVSFTAECSLETTRTTLKEQSKSSKASTASIIGYAIAGVALTAVGTGLMVASKNPDHRVYCGEVDEAPKAGDSCWSDASTVMEVGLITLGTGLGLGGIAGFNAMRKPTVETVALPAEHVTTITPEAACGNDEALEGMIVALELSNGSRWLGQVAKDGAFSVEVSPEVLGAGEARAFVDSVPATLAGLIARGALLGTISLVRDGGVPRQRAHASR
jgi:hypothetical protein